MRAWIASLSLLVAVGFGAAACGGDDGGADAAPPDAVHFDAPIDVVTIDVAVCHTCSDILSGNGDPPLCAGSEALFTALNDCICTGACMSACASNLCLNMAPTTECTSCQSDTTAGCGNELNACAADM